MSIQLACIGGTAATDLLRRGRFAARRMGPQLTPFGESQPLYLCRADGRDFYFLARHGDNGLPTPTTFVNYRANIFALKSLGVQAVISWSDTRAITHNLSVGDFVLVDDVIDETHSRPTTFFENTDLGGLRQWPVFCPHLRTLGCRALAEEKAQFAEKGVYVCVEGPRRETPAEARKYAVYGADVIGYSLAPEVFLAKELQLCYASLCIVSEYAENGSDFQPFENGRVLDRAEQIRRGRAALERLPRILERFGELHAGHARTCGCDQSMQHHIDHGAIGRDWRAWFSRDVPMAGTPPLPQAGRASFANA